MESKVIRPFPGPLFALKPNEVEAKWQAGELTTEDVFRYTTIKRFQKFNILDLDPDEVTYLHENKYIDDKTAEAYTEYKNNPKMFYLKDIIRGTGKGVLDATKEAYKTAADLLDYIAPDNPVSRAMYMSAAGLHGMSKAITPPQTFIGRAAEPLAEFGVGFLPMSKALGATQIFQRLSTQAPKLASLAKATIASIGADVLTVDPLAERLSNVIEEYPKLANPVTAYLKAEPDDSYAEAKFKTTLEDILLGLGFEGLSELMFRTIKTVKSRVWAKHHNIDDVARYVNKKVKTPEEAPPVKPTEAQVEVPQVKPVETPPVKPAEAPPVKPAEAPPVKPAEAPPAKPQVEPVETTQSLFELSSEDLSKIAKNIYEDITGVTPPPQFLSDFNIEKYKGATLDEALTLMESVSKHVVKEIDRLSGGRVITFEAADRAARRIAKKWHAEGQLLLQARKFQHDTLGLMARVRAFDRLMSNMAERTIQLAKRAQELGTDEAYLDAQAMIETFAEFQAAVKAGQRNIARGLAVKRLMRPGVRGLDLTDVLAEIQKSGRANLERVKALVDLVPSLEKDPRSLAHFVKTVSKYRILQGLIELKQAALLSGWPTHVANVVGNTIAMAVDALELTSGLFAESVARNDLTPLVVGGGQYVKGLLEGFVEALRVDKKGFLSLAKTLTSSGPEAAKKELLESNLGNVWKAFFSNEGIIDPAIKIEGQTLGVIPDFAWLPLGSIIRLPFRFLTAADEFFKTVAYHAQKNAELFYEVYHVQGLRGRDLDRQIRVLAHNLPESIHVRAMHQARELTFTEEGQLAKTLSKFFDPGPEAHPATMVFGPLAKLLFMPFYRVAVNLTSWAARRTPLGVFGKRFLADIEAGGFRAKQAYARLVIGTLLLFTGWSLYRSGKITGFIPPERKAVATSLGVQPYAIYNPDDKTWVSYNRFDPAAILLSLGANLGMLYDYYEADTYDTAEDLLKASLLAITDAVTSRTWIESVHQVLTLLTDPERMNFGKFLANQISTMFPFEAAAREIQRVTDDVARESQDVFTPGKLIDLQEAWDAFWTKHVNSGKLRVRRDPIFGTPVAQMNRHWSGGWETSIKDDPVVLELAKIGLSIGLISNKITRNGQTIELTPDQVNRLLENLERLDVHGMLKRAIESPRYQAIPDPQEKQRVLKQLINSARDAARDMLLAEDPKLASQLVEKLERKKEVLLGLANPQGDPKHVLKNWFEAYHH